MQQQRQRHCSDRHARDDRHREHPRDIRQAKERRVARDGCVEHREGCKPGLSFGERLARVAHLFC